MKDDEAPAVASTAAMQDALRGLLAEMSAHAGTAAKVDGLVAAVHAQTARLDQHLRESAAAELDRAALAREVAEIRVDLKRLADAKVAAVTYERERLDREAKAATEAETRWKGRAAPLGALLIALALLAERLIARLTGGNP